LRMDSFYGVVLYELTLLYVYVISLSLATIELAGPSNFHCWV